MRPAFSDPDDLVWQAVGRALGVETFALLAAVPIEALSDAGRAQALARVEQLTAHLAEFKARLTAAIAGPTPTAAQLRRGEFSAHDVCVATNCSVYAADGQISFARDLAERLTATAEAMADGQISERQARHLSEATGHVDVEVAREIEAKVLKFSHRQDLPLFRLSVRRWLAKLDPDFTARATKARTDCVVEHTPGDDGTGTLFIRGPLEITTDISTALDGYATKTKPELGGTTAQRKLAGLREMTESYLACPDCPTRHGRTPTVNVTIDLATLLGLRDGVAEIPGAGAIPASAAAWLLADGAPLRQLIIDPDNGQPLDYGRTTYLVPPALADHLIAKHVTSAGPHSQIDAAGGDIDHHTPYDHGGHTDPVNCTPLDRRWHRAKTHAEWTYTKNPDTGINTWTSPTSLTTQTHPYDYRAGP